METGLNFYGAYRGRRVWVSGHTGFKGSWLCEWLLELGAEVHGYALEPDTDPSLFVQLGLASRIRHLIGDVRDPRAVRAALEQAKPDFVFHLAAQPLVRRSYQKPVETFETNVMGTVHVLEALKEIGRPCTAVLVTTDKCYENEESGRAYREDDRLGGRDPYSASKAMAELAVTAYRRSFLDSGAIRVATARAGNVIGGGDWAEDRIVPDCIRALRVGAPIQVRNPVSTRPWQHVLEPLAGYLLLAAALERNSHLPRAFNFGPKPESNRTVRDLVEGVLRHWPGKWEDLSEPGAVHEAKLLSLDVSLAGECIGWNPRWGFEKTLRATAEWYLHYHQTRISARDTTCAQILEFMAVS